MPLLQPEEIRDMDESEREEKLEELRDELLHEKGVAAMGGAPESPGRISTIKKTIARILTVINEEKNEKTKGGN
ncbi:MAG: 50S ribosomal protein L29 [Candidatus Thermoplasmatota archaeon]|nr:50S ribosomal protein L29 [Candidatus Thermoplasmatota archaeon]